MINKLKLIKRSLQLSIFVKNVHFYVKRCNFDIDSTGRPFLIYKDIKLTGFETQGQELSYYKTIKPILPKNLPSTHYRLIRDFITRYVFPHMIPTQTVNSIYPKYILSGFHGQHSDAIPHIKNKQKKEYLNEIFTILEDDVIINGGAFLGFGDAKVSQINKNGKIIAVEASENCFEMLKLNISNNNLNNVHPYHAALWRENGKMNLSTSEFQANSLIEKEIVDKNKEKIMDTKDKEFTETISIDSLVEKFSLRKVDYVSLTINGAEPEAIDGMKNTLNNFKPRIRLAGWYVRGKPIWKLCSERLKDFDYDVTVGKHGSFYAYPKTKN